MGAMRNLSRKLALCAAVLLLGASAQGTPLGLQIGDVVESIEWDALQNISGGPGGDGGSFTSTGTNTGDTTMDGRLTSVTVEFASTSLVSDTNFVLEAALSAVSVLSLGGSTVLVSKTFVGVAGHDITVTDGTGTILTAELAPTGFVVGGIYDLSGTLIDATAVANAVDISVTGGDDMLVAALGGIGSGASLELDGTIFDFVPSMGTILENGVIDEDYTYSGTGTIQPTEAAPFVPEPGTLMLMGLGLLGLSFAGSQRRR